MQELSTILDKCFEALSKEYEIEKVDYLPNDGEKKHFFVPVWRLIVQANIGGKLSDVEIYMAFPKEFPYVMPVVVVPDERLRFLPHISYGNRKLCLYEDGIVYDVGNIYGLIRDNIFRTRQWIEHYSNQDNTREFASEIKNYWSERYDNESEVEPHWILLGAIPKQTCELQGLSYPVDFLGKYDKYFEQVIVFKEGQDDGMLNNIKTRYKCVKITVLFIKSFSMPATPPYSMTGRDFLGCIKDEGDRKTFIQFINKNRKGCFLFSLGTEYLLGGVTIPQLNVNRNGFRPGSVSAIEVLTRLEYKNKNLGRIRANIYEKNRMAERTSGQIMNGQYFVIVGLGSVGGNLCYYLNGYNNARFALVDKDNLTIDNMGRHLLGFNYIDQRKVDAVSDYLTNYRPDRKVDAVCRNLEEYSIEELNKASALFLCTGDVMSEQWLLNKIAEGLLTIPTFILWLEPYAVSGIMIYINPDDTERLRTIIDGANDGFLDYCLIHRDEYGDGKKLTKKDAGCNGTYAIYSANDVTLFLSSMFPYIDSLLSTSKETGIYQWIGNIEMAKQRDITLSENASGHSKNDVLRIV